MRVRTSIAKTKLLPGALCLTLLAIFSTHARAQRVIPQPVTDSSAQASPLAPVRKAPVADASIQASPISPERTGGPSIAAQTVIPIALEEDIDSGKLKQGQNVRARLTGSVPLRGGGALPAGTPVTVTVIETVAAGRIMAQGEFSLQIVRVGNVDVFTDTQVFDGKPGHQDLPDSAPALGTDAGLPSGAPLTFHVQPPPTAVDNPAAPTRDGPGSVDGVAVGGPPPASTLKSTYDNGNGGGKGPGSGNTPGQQQRAVSPGDTTTNQQTQQSGQPSVAPNQPQSPAQTSPSPTTPH